MIIPEGVTPHSVITVFLLKKACSASSLRLRGRLEVPTTKLTNKTPALAYDKIVSETR